MPLRVFELKAPVGVSEGELLDRALRRAHLRRDDLESIEIVRRSLDRRRHPPTFSFTIDLHLREDVRQRSWPRGSGIAFIDPVVLPDLPAGEAPLESPPVVVGAGPAGLMAALHLARKGFRPVVLERGDAMNLRVRAIRDLNRDHVLDPESNYLFGEGGAGTFSDGKLTSRSKDPRARVVLDEYRIMSGVPSVSFDYRPHLGSDRVRTVVGRMRREILALGGAFKYRCRVEELDAPGGVLRGLKTSEGDLPAEVVVLAPGHSARDLVRRLCQQGVIMERKPFQLGLRVEHSQDWVDRQVFGTLAGHPDLGPADYRLVVKARGASVFSFCMCPGGEIIPAISDLGHMNTNGMSWSGKATGFANSGLVTTVEPEAFPGEGPLAGLDWQAVFEERGADLVGHSLRVPAQRLLDWMAGRPSGDLPASSCKTGLLPAALSEVVPAAVHRLMLEAVHGMDRQLPGFLQDDALLVGPECRSSSPVRIIRDHETLESTGLPGLYPVGEGAGYAGGIVSAATDGLRAAERIAARYRPSGPDHS